jgi:adenylate kinase
VKEGTELGRMAGEVMKAGGLVGDDIMIGIVDERLSRPDAARRGYILDGFPRTVAQAEALGEITQPRPLDLVVDLDVPRELVVERISRRRVCRDCGSNYTASSSDSAHRICERCGGDIVQREDDTPEAINQRLDLYDTQTAPLIAYYSARGMLAVVNGVGHPDHVFDRLVKAIDAARDRRA